MARRFNANRIAAAEADVARCLHNPRRATSTEDFGVGDIYEIKPSFRDQVSYHTKRAAGAFMEKCYLPVREKMIAFSAKIRDVESRPSVSRFPIEEDVDFGYPLERVHARQQ